MGSVSSLNISIAFLNSQLPSSHKIQKRPPKALNNSKLLILPGCGKGSLWPSRGTSPLSPPATYGKLYLNQMKCHPNLWVLVDKCPHQRKGVTNEAGQWTDDQGTFRQLDNC
eukprot:613979-Amphidinium_carterae.1